MVAASDLVLAGCNPAAYVESFVELLEDDGMDEDAARIGAAAAALALRALLEGPAAAIEQARRAAGADEPHGVRCPVCGGEAAVAQVGDAPAGQGRGKRLWCGHCGCVWDFERVRCARCGTQNQGHLHYFNLEGDEAHRLAACDECGGYTRTVYQADALAPFSFEVEDVLMAKLDLVAYQRAAADAAAGEREAPARRWPWPSSSPFPRAQESRAAHPHLPERRARGGEPGSPFRLPGLAVGYLLSRASSPTAGASSR